MDCPDPAIGVQEPSDRFFFACADLLRLCFLFSRQSCRCDRRLPWHSSARWSMEFFQFGRRLLTAGVLTGIVGMVVRRLVRPTQRFRFSPPMCQCSRKYGRESFAIPSVVAGFIIFHVGCRLLFKATQVALARRRWFQPVSSFFAAFLAVLSPARWRMLNHFFWWGALGFDLAFSSLIFRAPSIFISFSRRSIWR